MFQSFTSNSDSSNSKKRLADLRAAMNENGIDWFLVPHADEHQNEYLPERAERLAWLTGFSGSAGFALIGLEQAFVFVDGRYTVQARSQVDTNCFELKDLISEGPTEVAKETISTDQRVGFDPWLLTMAQKENWEKVATDIQAMLSPTQNLIDQIWTDQPKPPLGKAWLHPVSYAGRSASEKLVDIRKQITKDKADYLLLTDPASIAWAFNLRGNDLIHNPLSLAWSLIPASDQKPLVFIDKRKLDTTNEAALGEIAELHPPSDLTTTLQAVSDEKAIHCDPNLVASSLAEIIKEAGGSIAKKRDPVVLLRAIKNEVELDGARQAHIRDGVAVSKFLAWLDKQPDGSVTEIASATRLEQSRAETALDMGSELKEISFDTISGAGANGAIVHYRVTEETDATLTKGSVYLVDSGGQYLDGTTDITRTVAIGTPPPEAITNNTLVLKGHIAIARAVFPASTRGVDLDALARMPLWQNGKDFAHGTGHGIGSYLNVHEGPQSISRRGMEAFQPGMIISNEPGYYKENEYGIRIENLVIVREAKEMPNGDKPMHYFETITLCPIDTRLIDATLMNKDEIDWLNQYHRRVQGELAPFMNSEELEWLTKATSPI